MKTKELQERFKTWHLQLEKIEHPLFGVREKYDLTCVDAGCRFCDIGKADKKRPFEERRSNCRADTKCKNVREAYEELLKMRREENEIHEAYARELWALLSERKPLIVRDATGEKVTWEDAFGANYDALSEPLKDSLVAIVEQDGGQYRLAE